MDLPVAEAFGSVVERFLESMPEERRERFVPDPGAVYVLGCSGGLDSSVLAVVYTHLFRRGQIGPSPVIFHLNHQLRLSAYRDERHVEALGRVLDLPVYTERFPVGAFARRLRLNLEEAGRLVRYRKLERLSRDFSRPVYAVTAHHANDFAETLLLKILRGATENAFRMPDLVKMDFSRRDGRFSLEVLRPLLFLDRTSLERLARDLRLKTREDPSNQSREFKRNRLRETVIPLLREEGLDVAALWLRLNGSPQRFGKSVPAAETDPERFPSFVRLPLSFLSGADAGETKSVLDRALRRLGCSPVQGDGGRGILGEILRQSRRGRILLRAPGWLLTSSIQSLWIVREDSHLLQPPAIENEKQGDAGRWMVRVRESRGGRTEPDLFFRGAAAERLKRTYTLPAGGSMGLYHAGLRTRTGRKAKELFHDLDVPVPLRANIPLELRDGHLVRICLSWIGERTDVTV